jgi:hypothetical protein
MLETDPLNDSPAPEKHKQKQRHSHNESDKESLVPEKFLEKAPSFLFFAVELTVHFASM